MDTKQLNQDIREAAAKLMQEYPHGYLHVTSISNRERNSTAGHTVEVSVAQAGKLLVENTHRVATPEEIAAFHVAADARRHAIEAAETRKQPSSFRVSLRQK
jgi:hypothetical protein